MCSLRRKTRGIADPARIRPGGHRYRRPVSYFLAEQEEVEPEDTTVKALFRTTQALNPEDRRQVLRFAQFLRQAGRPPTQASEEPKE